MQNQIIAAPTGFAMLGRISEWRVLRSIHRDGPLSRIEVAQAAGVTPPTAARAVEALLETGWLIEEEPLRNGRGRPARKLRIPGETLHVLGIVVDGTGTRVVAGGLDGSLRKGTLVNFPPFHDYETLLDTIADAARSLSAAFGAPPVGIGIALPGLVDYANEQVVLCPGVPLLNGHTLARDLESRLGQTCRLIQEDHGLCLAERASGNARGLEEFTVFNVGTSIGLGAISGGSLLMGHDGFSGSIGHITVLFDGKLCGCGNHGCLEAEAGGISLLETLAKRKGHTFTAEEVLALLVAGDTVVREEIERMGRLVAVGVAAAINLFNPSSLFLHGFFLSNYPPLFERIVEETRRRTLPPSFDRCHIALSGVTKLQGALASIIDQLMNARLPDSLSGISSLPASRPARKSISRTANSVSHVSQGGKLNVSV